MGHRLGEGRDVVGETVVGVDQPRVQVRHAVVGLAGEVEAVGVGHQTRTKRQGQLGLQVSGNNHSILDESRTGPPCHLSGIFPHLLKVFYFSTHALLDIQSTLLPVYNLIRH